MKRTITLLLSLTLLLGGCGEKESAAADIQAQYGSIATAELEAEVTFHMAQEDRSFTLQCAYTPQESTITVTAPETVKGISATVTAEGLSIAYQGAVLSAGKVGDIGPVNALPCLLRAVAEGYLVEEGRETVAGVDCRRLTLDTMAGETAVTCTAWLDAETLLPRYAELSCDGAVLVSITPLAFSCTLDKA